MTANEIKLYRTYYRLATTREIETVLANCERASEGKFALANAEIAALAREELATRHSTFGLSR